MSKKKKRKNDLGKINIKGADDMKEMEKEPQIDETENEINEEVIEKDQQQDDAELRESEEDCEQTEEADTQDAEDQEEPLQEECDQEVPETQACDDTKPGKKERKLKWARSAQKDFEEEIAGFEEKVKEANDKYARLFAEFDNFRKRSEKEKMQRYDFGAKDMIERILPVIDNFERGLAAVPEEKAEDSFVKGMEMTYKQLLKALEDAGVKPIEAVGQEFNPDFHNAVMHIDDPEAGENIIVEEFQKGYMYKDHVVRYSMVKVAN